MDGDTQQQFGKRAVRFIVCLFAVLCLFIACFVHFLSIRIFYCLETMTYFNMTSFFFSFFLFLHFLSVFCEPCVSLQYSREFLFLLRNSGGGSVDPLAAFPAEVVQSDFTAANRECASKPKGVRKRGSRGGMRQRLKRQGHRRIPLPTVMLANVQSLRNKLDELRANVKFLKEFREACLLAFTETWLKEQDSYSDLEIDGFGEPYRLDRDPTVNG